MSLDQRFEKNRLFGDDEPCLPASARALLNRRPRRSGLFQTTWWCYWRFRWFPAADLQAKSASWAPDGSVLLDYLDELRDGGKILRPEFGVKRSTA